MSGTLGNCGCCAPTPLAILVAGRDVPGNPGPSSLDRKSTRLNFSHLVISHAVFCLKKTAHGRMIRSGRWYTFCVLGWYLISCINSFWNSFFFYVYAMLRALLSSPTQVIPN